METKTNPFTRPAPPVRPTSSEVLVAWDIETVPLPTEGLSASQQQRLTIQVDSLRKREPDLDEDALVRKASSLHPELGRIAVISAVGVAAGALRPAASWVAPAPDDERAAIEGFLTAASHAAYRRARFVTMNGKRFDVPFLLGRVAHHHLAHLLPSNGMLDTYPFKQRPHADLANLWTMPSSLDSLCDHLGVETPKGEMCGADVAQAVADGRIDEVRRYCERDVVATAECYLALGSLVDA